MPLCAEGGPQCPSVYPCEDPQQTGYEPKDYFLTETYVESTTESMTDQRIPEQRFPKDVDYDDAAIGEMLFEAYREQVYHSQREGLSVGQSSSSVFQKNGETRQNWDLREAHEKSLKEMEELKFQSSTFDTIARRTLVENQDTSLELSGRVQELQNETNCMNNSRDFQDAESVRSGYSHVTSQPAPSPPHPVPGGMLSRSIGLPSRREGPPSIWYTHGIPGNVFADPVASSTAPYPQELNPWSSGRAEPIHSSTADQNENRTPVQDQRCQSGPSAKNSVIPSEGTLQRIMEQTNNDCRFQIFISTNSLHQQPLLVGR